MSIAEPLAKADQQCDMRAMLRPDIDAVGRLLKEVADEHIMPRWKNLAPGDIATKSGPMDLVTVADRETEAALAARLTARYPSSRLIGEETFASDPDCLAVLDGGAPVWISDPIDGTRAFTRGDPGFASMLVLVEARQPVVAWIYQPVTGDLYCGERGGGVWHVAADGTRCRLHPAAPTSPRQLIGIASGNLEIDGQRIYRSQRADRFAALKDMWCPGIDYPKVLTGEAHFTVYAKCLPWDHLPGIMMMREVGWVDQRLDRTPYGVTDLAGGLMCAPSRDALETIRQRLTR